MQILARAYRTIANVLSTAISPFFYFSDVVKPGLVIALTHDNNEKAELVSIASQRETNTYSLQSSISKSGKLKVIPQTVSITGTGIFSVSYTAVKRTTVHYVSYRSVSGTRTTTTGFVHVQTLGASDYAYIAYTTAGNNLSINVDDVVLEVGDVITCSIACSAYTSTGDYAMNLLVSEHE